MDELFWIWLTLVNGVGPVKGHELIRKYGSAQLIYEHCRELKEFSSSSQYDEAFEKAKLVLDECEKQQISLLSYGDDSYKEEWKNRNDFPILMYIRGCFEWRNLKGVGIVGARRCTEWGKQRAIEIASDTVIQNKTVISGMAKGIDSYAHTAALKAGGNTVAVLGNGVDICYPREHDKLYREICEKGMVVSEYPPGTSPKKYYFPRRNRIIAGFSDILYVIEAGERSGTRSTVQAAQKYEKMVVFMGEGKM